MEDQNQNMIPDKWDRLILRVGTALVGIGGTVATVIKAGGGAVPLWLTVVLAAVPAALVVFSFGGGVK